MMDTVGNKVARKEIAMIKVIVPNMTLQVIDWAIQAHGAGGVTSDFPLALLWAASAPLRIADGRTRCHRNAIAKTGAREVSRQVGQRLRCRSTAAADRQSFPARRTAAL
jgi:acyl-CoA dehydrogenase